jgi:hypothetical protein
MSTGQEWYDATSVKRVPRGLRTGLRIGVAKATGLTGLATHLVLHLSHPVDPLSVRVDISR